MATHFISDLHLSADTPRLITGFVRLLRSIPRGDSLYVLGDLFDAWPGDDEDGDWANEVRTALKALAKHGEITLLHGNRDFMLGDQMAAACGMTLVREDVLHVQVAGRAAVLAHGDTLCTDDVDYQRQRPQLRDRSWQSQLLEQPLEARRALAAALRGASESHKANLPAAIMDVNPDAVEDLFATSGTQLLIHGHTHRPGIHRHQGGTRLVLGDWRRCGWHLVAGTREFALRCIPLP